jgi:hypothetical protein
LGGLKGARMDIEYEQNRIISSIENILNEITYKDGYTFKVFCSSSYIATIRVTTFAPCTNTGITQYQEGRLFIIENPDNEAEIVRAAYQALYLFELHEFQEHFKYKGNIVFDPHGMNLQ